MGDNHDEEKRQRRDRVNRSKEIAGYLLLMQKIDNFSADSNRPHFMEDMIEIFEMEGMPHGFLDPIKQTQYQIKVEPGK